MQKPIFLHVHGLRYVILCLLLSFCTHGNSQSAVVPDELPSHDAIARARYSFFPVSLNSGQVNSTVPVCELDASHTVMPISISYDHSGVKINDHPGQAGLNWS